MRYYHVERHAGLHNGRWRRISREGIGGLQANRELYQREAARIIRCGKGAVALVADDGAVVGYAGDEALRAAVRDA